MDINFLGFSCNKRLFYYSLLGIVVLSISIIGATFGYLSVSTSINDVIVGDMAVVDVDLSVVKVTNADEDIGLIPMSNNMVEMALQSSNGVCVDDNGNVACQVYKITVSNRGSSNTFVDAYVSLTGGSGAPADYTEYVNNTEKTTMRWAQAFCSEESNGIVTSCTTAGSSTARTDDEVVFDALGGEDVADDFLNLAEIKTTRNSVVSTKTINTNNYEIINKNYIRVSDRNPGSTIYTHGGDVTSALVYNQYLSANDGDTSNDTGTSSSTFTDSQVYYIVLWLSETGRNQTAGAEGAATVTDDFFGGKVTVLSSDGSNTAKFGNYASGADGGNNSATNFVKNLYNDGTDLTAVNIGNNELNPTVYLNTNQGIMMDNNGDYRYYGADPDNYVKFNDELWRIISVSNVKSGTSDDNGVLRMKLIRNAALGSFSWDSSDSTVNSGNGVNDWSQADLMTELNTLYYNKEEGTCYTGGSNNTSLCSFATTGLSGSAQDQIDTALYYLGTGGNGYPNVVYTSERSTTVYEGRPTSWEGIVALMYPSDYGYAADLSLCTVGMGSYNSDDCKNNNWLYYSSSDQWTLSPYSGTAPIVSIVSSSGTVYCNGYASNAKGVRPVVYLRSDVSIVSGEGTKEVPYVLG